MLDWVSFSLFYNSLYSEGDKPDTEANGYRANNKHDQLDIYESKGGRPNDFGGNHEGDDLDGGKPKVWYKGGINGDKFGVGEV